MASYKIEFKASVAKDFKPIPKHDVQRIVKAIEQLKVEPRPVNAIKLSAQERYRLRVGQYRVLYEIVDSRLLITVVKVAHRKHVRHPTKHH